MNEFNLNDLVTDGNFTGRVIDVWLTESGIQYHVENSQGEVKLLREENIVRCY